MGKKVVKKAPRIPGLQRNKAKVNALARITVDIKAAQREAKKGASLDRTEKRNMRKNVQKYYDFLYANTNAKLINATEQDIGELCVLVDSLLKCKYNEAAEFIENCAPGLGTFKWEPQLIDMFAWNETPQGYDYWEEIWWDLVGSGYEDLPEQLYEDFTKQTVSDGDTDMLEEELKKLPGYDGEKPHVKISKGGELIVIKNKKSA